MRASTRRGFGTLPQCAVGPEGAARLAVFRTNRGALCVAGTLDSCNHNLAEIFGVPEHVMHSTPFTEWMVGPDGPTRDGTLQLRDKLSECVASSRRAVVREARIERTERIDECSLRESSLAEPSCLAELRAAKFVTYHVAPLMQHVTVESSAVDEGDGEGEGEDELLDAQRSLAAEYDRSSSSSLLRATDRSEGVPDDGEVEEGSMKQVGVLLLLEDNSELAQRLHVQEELSKAKKSMAQMESQLSTLQRRSSVVHETPLQKSIDIVRSVLDDQVVGAQMPALHEKLNDVLTQLHSRDLLAPALFSDMTELSKIDQATREFLKGQDLNLTFTSPPIARPPSAGAASGTNGTADEEPTTPGRSMSHDDGRGLYSSRSQPLSPYGSELRASRRPSAAGKELVTQLAPLAALPPCHISSTVLYHLDGWELDLFDSSPDELVAVTIELFGRLGLGNDVPLVDSVLGSFVATVRSGYLPQPFHNFSHAVYTLHGCVTILSSCPVACDVLRPVDRLCLAVAALGHDIGHTGTNNTFLVSSSDPLALQYNDRSVLENMHAARLFSVLRHHRSSPLASLDAAELRDARRLIIGAILATDLSQHFADLSKFKNRVSSDKPWSSTDSTDRQMLTEVVLHAADLSGPTRPWDVTSVWAGKVQAEFNAQLEMEAQLGLPVSTFMQVRPSLILGPLAARPAQREGIGCRRAQTGSADPIGRRNAVGRRPQSLSSRRILSSTSRCRCGARSPRYCPS